MNRTIHKKQCPQFISKAECTQLHLAAGKKGCHFLLSLCTRKLYSHALIHDSAAQENNIKTRKYEMQLYVKGMMLQSIFPPPSRRKDLLETRPQNVVSPHSPINYRAMTALTAPNGCPLGLRGQQLYTTAVRRGKSPQW